MTLGGITALLVSDLLGQPENFRSRTVAENSAATFCGGPDQRCFAEMTTDATLFIHGNKTPFFCLVGGKTDDSFFIEYPDALYPLLLADLLHHLIDPLAIILEHLVMCGSDDGFAEVVEILQGGLKKRILKGAYVEKREEDHGDQQGGAREHDELGGQLEAQGSLPEEMSSLRFSAVLAEEIKFFYSNTCRKIVDVE